MTAEARLGGDGRLRLFLALPLPDDVLDALVAWQRRGVGAPADARLVPRPNLHVTLVFLGSTARAAVPGILSALRAAATGTAPPVLRARRYRETPRVGMIELDDSEGRAGRLTGRLAADLERLGVYRPERRPWSPHVTVVRFRRAPRLRPAPPDLGAFSPSEVALYHSVLRPAGAQYEKRESVALGG